jgi:hypothetical protein
MHPLKTREHCNANGNYNQNNLLYKQSTIPNAGNGVFTNITYYKNDYITEFTGQLTNNPNISDADALWTYKLGQIICIGLKTPTINRGMGSFINSSKYPIFKTNTKVVKADNNRLYIQATSIIQPNRELFYPYGNTYWHRYRSILAKTPHIILALQNNYNLNYIQ